MYINMMSPFTSSIFQDYKMDIFVIFAQILKYPTLFDATASLQCW